MKFFENTDWSVLTPGSRREVEKSRALKKNFIVIWKFERNKNE